MRSNHAPKRPGFRHWTSALALGALIVLANASGGSSVTAAPGHHVVLEGLIVDENSGEFPHGDSIIVYVGDTAVHPDSEGLFQAAVLREAVVLIRVESRGFETWTRSLALDSSKSNVFITCVLTSRKTGDRTPGAPDAVAAIAEGPPWTVSGAVIDSRLDLAIESDSILLLFDRDTVAVSDNGAFRVRTRKPGFHTFVCRIPGYHEAIETVELTERDRQPFVIIPTTTLDHEVKRREITVTASRQELHQVARQGRTRLSRTELTRTSATLNDPIRALHTLPGVASESDASARPVVRGGDIQESRAFLDGIPLLQPYHFGGVRSTFNQLAMDNITFYKTGFPARYHNAQAAVIVAESRMPATDSFALDLDGNLLQYDLYLGVPLFDRHIGLSGAVQGSYFDFMQKRVADIVAAFSGDDYLQEQIDQYKQLVNMPDYQDYALGLQFRPGDKVSVYVGEVYNSDRFWFTQGDTVTPYTHYAPRYYYVSEIPEVTFSNAPYEVREESGQYYYFFIDSTGASEIDSRLRDTVLVWTERRSSWWGIQPVESSPAGGPADRVVQGNSFFEIDTMLHYKSNYNILYATARYLPADKHVVDAFVGWQRRWWDLDLPTDGAFILDVPSVYDVSLDQFNSGVNWLYSGIADHIISAGVQADYTRGDFDVYTPRAVHEIITNGNTNFADFWGPITGDSGLTLVDDSAGYAQTSLWDITNRLLVEYTGSARFGNGALYAQDAWDITPRLHLDGGLRLELSMADTAFTVSPRASVKYRNTDAFELFGSVGHYTQNNYDIAALALSTDLKPEKVWHADAGFQWRILSWLELQGDIWGKRYYDLTSERLEPIRDPEEFLLSDIYSFLIETYGSRFVDSLAAASRADYERLVMTYILSNEYYETFFTNEGRGYGYGFEYFLRYAPADFWHGWFSLSLGRSFRQRAPGWRWHAFPIDRPWLFSFVNYYRLPRKYELSVKYRYMSGMPYTAVSFENGIRIGPYNDRRYGAYQRLDLKIAKGFSLARGKGHFYLETWNALNEPNVFLIDRESKEHQSFGFNLMFTALFLGIDFSW